MVKHIVLFAYKDGADQESLKELHKRFTALPNLIPEVKGFEWGVNMSPENQNQGLTDGYVLTFKDAESRDAYLIHREHKIFADFAGPMIEKVLVFDYTVAEIV